MLLPPRIYSLAQTPDQASDKPAPFLVFGSTLKEEAHAQKKAREMLLLHQTGSVKVGETIRYTITYTPSADRILPTPPHLHVKVKNTSAIPLRAAYLHGPYNVHVSAYPASFNPNQAVEHPRRDGVPTFEPNLKAGGSWNARLTVPEDIRESGSSARQQFTNQEPRSVIWIVDIASQVMFSKTASVNFEVLVSRDERSLELGITSIGGSAQSKAGHLSDHQQGAHKGQGSHGTSQKGVYSKAVRVVVDDTQSLWNKPPLPEWDEPKDQKERDGKDTAEQKKNKQKKNKQKKNKQKKVHLVILTHGLHSNLGADMLYMKESIDATVKNAREAEAKRKKSSETKSQPRSKTLATDIGENDEGPSTAQLSGGQEDLDNTTNVDGDDEEMVVVRGFPGNAVRTERGIQFLGKRLAKYVLNITYPDQPYKPEKKSFASKMSQLSSPTSKQKTDEGIPGSSAKNSENPPRQKEHRAYRYTQISFIGHSLGGLVQTYAIAYIQKHSPGFFDVIEPVNFIALASPFLGLSNENPVYVKFALDFGLVGRTGQDLGLTWTAPTIAKSGWTSMVSGLGANNQKEQKTPDPGSKPLLRILPTGPAHQVLRRFRNRTVYSNVVNDGIVPLRTSCLLFLDWRGLGRVDKARRENGLIGTVAEWGFQQLTGQNTSPSPSRPNLTDPNRRPRTDSRAESPSFSEDDTAVPQPGEDITNEDDTLQTKQTTRATEPVSHQFLKNQRKQSDSPRRDTKNKSDSMILNGANTLSKFLSFLQPSGAHTAKDSRMFQRSQTVKADQATSSTDLSSDDASSSRPSEGSASANASNKSQKRPRATIGDSILNDPEHRSAPPKTTIFESAGDLIHPPLPPSSWIIDPSTRWRTIFHDRVYHPEDIPALPQKQRPPRSSRSFGSQDSISSNKTDETNEDGSSMKVEEKIARAYHKDLSWRKVLVRLEPDAHNNIIVRRMFANAYGWPVVKHLCDTHFGDTWSAKTRDEHEPAVDRALHIDEDVGERGEEVRGQHEREAPKRSNSEMREAADELKPLREAQAESPTKQKLARQNSGSWDDSYFEGSSDDSDHEIDDSNAFTRYLNPPKPPQSSRNSASATTGSKLSTSKHVDDDDQIGTSPEEIARFLTASPTTIEGHRGLSPTQSRPTSSIVSPVSPTYSAAAPGEASTGAIATEPLSPTATTSSSTATIPKSSTSTSPRDADSLQSMVPGQSLLQSSPPFEEVEESNTGGSTSNIGLRKSIEEQMGSPISRRRSGSASGGVGEQVARFSAEGGRG